MRVKSFILFCALLLGALLVSTYSPYGYAVQDREHIATAPGGSHLVGTDELGRDRAARLSLALLLSFGGACCASALSTAIALALGGLAAFSPRWVSGVLLYLGDLSLTLPWLFLLMLVRAALPLNLHPLQSGCITFALLAVLGAPVFLRLNHQRTSNLMLAAWMDQSRAAGLRGPQIVAQLWPHLKPALWAQFLLFIPASVIAEANLGTLGLGLTEPLPSLGSFLATLQSEALLSTSRLIYLPVAVMVLALVALELSLFGAEL